MKEPKEEVGEELNHINCKKGEMCFHPLEVKEEWDLKLIAEWKLHNGEKEPPRWIRDFISQTIQETEERLKRKIVKEFNEMPVGPEARNALIHIIKVNLLDKER